MRVVLAMIVIGFFPAAAHAQAGTFSDTPICSTLINKTGFTIYGSVETNKVTQPNGETAYYKSNLRLGADETTQICSSGPFFEGQRVTLSLRSLFPVFECKTALGKPITLNAKRNKTDTGYDWSATCY